MHILCYYIIKEQSTHTTREPPRTTKTFLLYIFAHISQPELLQHTISTSFISSNYTPKLFFIRSRYIWLSTHLDSIDTSIRNEISSLYDLWAPRQQIYAPHHLKAMYFTTHQNQATDYPNYNIENLQHSIYLPENPTPRSTATIHGRHFETSTIQ